MLKFMQENKKFQGLGWVTNRIWDLERCRRHLFFFLKNNMFCSGALPQTPFYMKKHVFLCWNVAAGAFLCQKKIFLVLERCRRRFFCEKTSF